MCVRERVRLRRPGGMLPLSLPPRLSLRVDVLVGMALRVGVDVEPPASVGRGVEVQVTIVWREGVLVFVANDDGVAVAVGAREGWLKTYATCGSNEPGIRLTSAA